MKHNKLMDNNQFDNEIKKMLEGLEVPFQDTHWERMSKRLKETPEINDANNVIGFDKIVSKKIADFEVPFDESHWFALHHRLLAETYLHKWILQTKIIESAVILVLGLFLMNTIKEKPQLPVFNGPIASTTTSSLHAQTLAEKSTASVELRSDSKIIHPIAQPISFVQSSDKPAATWKVLSPLLPSTGEAIANTVYSGSIATDFITTYVIDFLPNGERLVPELVSNDVSLPAILVSTIDAKRPYSFSVYGQLNADHILMDQDVAGDIWSPGYGVGMALSKNFGMLSLSLGVEYQQIKYSPTPVVHVTQGNAMLGYAGTGTTQVGLSLVNIPLTLGYDVLNRPKHKLSVNLGFVAGIGRESFDQTTFLMGVDNADQEEELLAITEFRSQPTVYLDGSPGTNELSNTSKSQTLSHVIQPSKFYGSARASVAYEFKLDKRHALFAKATFTKPLTNAGIGLPNDQVNSVGFQFGSRVYL